MPPDITALARGFADDLSDLLNRTVVNGVRIQPLLSGQRVAIGHKLSKLNLGGEAIPLSLGRIKPRVWLHASMFYVLDHESLPTITKSTAALYAGPQMDDQQLVVAADYSREPTNDYPAAHLHTFGAREDLDAVCLGTQRATRSLRDLHLPVGGRRFRPTVEDLIEFAIVESMVEPAPGWRSALEGHRDRWFERQLRAAVRGDQDSAAHELRRLGWSVEPPSSA